VLVFRDGRFIEVTFKLSDGFFNRFCELELRLLGFESHFRHGGDGLELPWGADGLLGLGLKGDAEFRCIEKGFDISGLGL